MNKKLKVLLLSDINSEHTQKWISDLIQNDLSIAVVSINPLKPTMANNYKCLNFKFKSGFWSGKNVFTKAVNFLISIYFTRMLIKEFQPDIVHSHYATSYGLIGRIAGFHPLFISVWGSDIYFFPRKSLPHRYLLSKNLKAADILTATSNILASEASQYTDKTFKVIPFGIETSHFKKSAREKNRSTRYIGTVKSMADIYGIDTLISSFKELKTRNCGQNLKLLLIGGGPQTNDYKQLCKSLSIQEDVEFIERVSNYEIPKYLNKMSVFVTLSRQESFGVSTLEAMACEIPVVVSRADGLAEIITDGETGIIVPIEAPTEAADAIEKILNDEEYALQIGQNGRRKVLSTYNRRTNVAQMIREYFDATKPGDKLV